VKIYNLDKLKEVY